MPSPFPRQIKKIEKREHKGQLGQWRKDFCKRYPNHLKQVRHHTVHSFLEAAAPERKRISCREGCTHCCHYYVTISVAHGVAIVDHLYKKRKWLARFLDNYEAWHGKGSALSERIDRKRLAAQSANRPAACIL